MMFKFKNKLVGKRIILKRTKPDLKLAKIMFKTIDEDREHLQTWLPFVKNTKKVEDTLKYLFDKEEETKKGVKVEYGLWIDGEYAGNISLFKLDEKNKNGEIGYWISSKFTRKGYTTEAVKIIEEYGFKKLGLNRIQIRCDTKNKGSEGVAKKAGYKLEGVLRKIVFSDYFNEFRDNFLFSKLKQEYNKTTKKKR